MARHGVIPESAARATRTGIAPLARVLGGAGVTPNMVTLLGITLSLLGSALLATERLVPALVVLLLGSAADTLDGAIARATGTGTKLGAFLDSTGDRIGDAAIFGAAAWLGASRGEPVLLAGALLAIASSSLVSYVRARAESLDIHATVGPAPREARLVLVIAGLAAWALLGLDIAFVAAVIAVAILATITSIQRIAAVARALRTRS